MEVDRRLDQRPCGALGLDPMWRIEMVALFEHVKREVGEHPTRSCGHATEVVGVAATAEREVDRLLESPQAVEVECG